MSDTTALERMIMPLLSWYAANKKQLPWRGEATPYYVWLSEIMLQQTRWTAVIPYYERFIKELPDVGALATADDDKLMKLWEGLGYYSRARNLKKAAVQIMEKYGGDFPRKAEELQKLAGIGAYTAGAIASICFGEPTPAVDGNVLRVIMRYTAGNDNIAEEKTKKAVADALRAIYPSGEDARHFTEALMELGEEICIPNGAPRCENCPLSEICAARQEGREREFPKKSPKKPRRIERRTVFLLSCRGRYAVRKRGSTGLLAGLWEIPNTLGALSSEEATIYLRKNGFEPLSVTPCGEALHIFTHVEWHMTGYLAECVYPLEEYVWADVEELTRDYAIPTAFRYYIEIMRRDGVNRRSL